ncbi:MAG TPA: HAD family hydrolase [Vicinamibacterales bacterium]|nr:HAD family hydrolase [Vicinamibacterales bacterium]
MKLSVLALDYDGTIARGDALDPGVRTAIAAARTRGVTVLLVTGRLLGDLRRVTGGLHFVDAVVAENGAVLHYPDSGYTRMLAPAVSAALVAELERIGLPFGAGECLVDADAREAPRLLDAIRRLELPLVLVFNGGRVMVLPQGVSKATGLQAALATLRLSPRNCVAIGDAENDHELLRAAEVGVAVEWGSAALTRAADIVVRGSGPWAVASFLDPIVRSGRLPVPDRSRRSLLLGYTEDGREFSLAIRGRNVLITGDAKTGKSWVAGLLAEQLILNGYCLAIIDPEGDYRALEALPGVTMLGGDDPPPTLRELSRALRYPDRSVVIDLSKRAHEQKVQRVRALLPALNALRRRTGLPHRIVIDEAHYYLHGADALQLLDLEENGYSLVTYWASRLPKSFLDAIDVMIVTSATNQAEVDALRECCAMGDADPEQWSLLTRLGPTQAVALPVTEEAQGALRLFRVGRRLTPHVRHREKYVDVPVAEYQAFVFSVNGRAPFRRIRTLREFVAALDGMPAGEPEPYVRRGDFSRWIGDVFGDRVLAAELRALEDRHRQTPLAETIPDIAAAIRARYELGDDHGCS